MKDLYGKTAAITGAGSGIGRMLAVNLAGLGCNLALADIDAVGLQETAALIGSGVKVTTNIVDVSKKDQVYAYAEAAEKSHGGVDLIINNAGVVVADFIETIPIEDFEWLMGINFWGVVYGSMAFLPLLRKRPEGHIVNISSINGIIPNPNNGPYCSAKFAVKGFTETLSQEMDGTGIQVSCVHPGGIKTSIVRNSRVNKTLYSVKKDQAIRLYEDELFRTTADNAAKIIIEGIRKNRRRILVGNDAKVIDLLARLLPVTAVRISTMLSKYFAKKYSRI